MCSHLLEAAVEKFNVKQRETSIVTGQMPGQFIREIRCRRATRFKRTISLFAVCNGKIAYRRRPTQQIFRRPNQRKQSDSQYFQWVLSEL